MTSRTILQSNYGEYLDELGSMRLCLSLIRLRSRADDSAAGGMTFVADSRRTAIAERNGAPDEAMKE
jgi:hypothetical protein